MKFAAAISRREKTGQAVQQIVASLKQQMPGEVDFLTVFFTPHHRDQAAALSALLRHELNPKLLIGTMGEGVIGGEREVEEEPAVSVLVGNLPGVTLAPFHLSFEDWEEMLSGDETAICERVRMKSSKDVNETRAFILFGDSYTTPIDELLIKLETIATAPIVGGMASGGNGPLENVLLLQEQVYHEGVVGVRIAGPIRVETIVSQGCRPIGETMLVTKADNNRVLTLGGRNALVATREMLEKLPREDQEMVENGLFMGIVINEYQPSFGRGDFLVRGVLGAEPDGGAIVIGDSVRAGQTVQFHIRDASTADEDLRLMMSQSTRDEAAPRGCLLFSCNGRGMRMFDMPNHDIRGVLEAVPETPIAGFFAQGELGPVGGKSFIHGHTASIVLFRPEL